MHLAVACKWWLWLPEDLECWIALLGWTTRASWSVCSIPITHIVPWTNGLTATSERDVRGQAAYSTDQAASTLVAPQANQNDASAQQ